MRAPCARLQVLELLTWWRSCCALRARTCMQMKMRRCCGRQTTAMWWVEHNVAADVVEVLLHTVRANVRTSEDEVLFWATDNGHVV
eukprot:464897-Pelagomonas_calceolata.AAC.2